MPYTIAVAGSTDHTRLLAEKILADSRFQIPWILTPSPRLIGRKQVLTKNPMHLFAEENNIPLVFVEKKIDEEVKKEIEEISYGLDSNRIHALRDDKSDVKSLSLSSTDYFFVVDFGYLIPKWLLDLPTIAPVNVHPSDLPKYRGSSPGQFTLLYGEKKSAVSVIIMNESLDEGDVIYQEKFDILSTFCTQDFYTFAFTLISEKIANILSDFAEKKIVPISQPKDSPTPIARRFSREDGYVEWVFLQQLTTANLSTTTSNQLLNDVYAQIGSWPQVISNAVRALNPWPGVWTIVPTAKGEKRMKILKTEMSGDESLLIKSVQLEGAQPISFEEARNQILPISQS